MDKDFFEGRYYKGKEFKGLMPKYYPEKYKKYIHEEVDLLKSKVNGANRILEAGVGMGRLIPHLAPLVKEMIGIEITKFMLEISKDVAKDFPNVKIIDEKIENVSNVFPENYFDYSLCVWNTLGNVEDPEVVLKELSKVTAKSIFITVFHKGTIKDRLEFYKAVDVTMDKIDEENEIFYHEGYTSKTFSVGDIEDLAQKTGLFVKETRVLGGVMLWAELGVREI